MATIDAGFDRGRSANTPSEMTFEGWKDILWRVYNEFLADRITLIAAGATFYLLLALFPALAAFVSLYGFVADPVTIADHIAFLGSVLPSGGLDLIRAQLQALAKQNNAALSFAFIFGLLFALWSANSGIKTLFEALNVAYDETEKRSFIRLNLISLAFTLGGIAIGILFIVCVGVVPAILAFAGLSGWEEILISLLRWPILIVVSTAAISILYRYGPSRERAKWRWVTWGSVLASIAWIAASILFSWYLANFADYNATYGSLGAVIGFMLWTWLSVVILLTGAELNAELEHQTGKDSTTGAPLPMGERGATMADTLGLSRDSPSAKKAEREAKEPMAFPAREKSACAQETIASETRSSLNRAPAPPHRDGGGSALLATIALGTVLELLQRRLSMRRAEPRSGETGKMRRSAVC
jgi:membrane protein